MIGEYRPFLQALAYLALVYKTPLHAQERITPVATSEDDTRLRTDLTKLYAQHHVLPIPIHRGGGMLQPENTIEAFEYAWARNLVPEADIRTSKDGVIIVIHDETVQRTAPGAIDDVRTTPVSDLTVAQLKTVDVGAFRGYPGQRIPTLDEVFALMAKDHGKFLHLDYKSVNLDQLAEMVKRHGIESQVIFTTDRYDLIQNWRQLVPRSQTMIWMGGTQEEINQKLDSLRANDFRDIYIVHMHYRPLQGTKHFNMNDQFMLDVQAELAEKGIILQVQPWDIEDPKVYEKLYSIGIRFVGTDFPDMMLLTRARFFR